MLPLFAVDMVVVLELLATDSFIRMISSLSNTLLMFRVNYFIFSFTKKLASLHHSTQMRMKYKQQI